jgi:hypothetical protein
MALPLLCRWPDRRAELYLRRPRPPAPSPALRCRSLVHLAPSHGERRGEDALERERALLGFLGLPLGWARLGHHRIGASAATDWLVVATPCSGRVLVSWAPVTATVRRSGPRPAKGAGGPSRGRYPRGSSARRMFRSTLRSSLATMRHSGREEHVMGQQTGRRAALRGRAAGSRTGGRHRAPAPFSQDRNGTGHIAPQPWEN